MKKIVKYSWNSRSAEYLWQYWFLYNLDFSNSWVTSINRVRKFVKSYSDISSISKWIIFGLIQESHWSILWDGIDTNWNLCTLVFINVDFFKIRLSAAIEGKEINVN